LHAKCYTVFQSNTPTSPPHDFKLETQEIKDTTEYQKDTATKSEIVFVSYAMKSAN